MARSSKTRAGTSEPGRRLASLSRRIAPVLIALAAVGAHAGLQDYPFRVEALRQGDEYEIRIDVTLSYVAQPKRTRRSTKRYLSTWLEWKSSRLGQSVEDFRSKALKDQEKPENQATGTTLPWTLGAQSNHGIDGARRNAGTVGPRAAGGDPARDVQRQ